MTVVFGALDAEIEAFVDAMEVDAEDHWHEFVFRRGTLAGRSVVVAKSGVGKSLAAMLTQRVIDVYHPHRIILTGVAGSINPGIEIGDTLVAVDCLQYDMDVTALGFKIGEIPYSPYHVLQCDHFLVERAMTCPPEDSRVGARAENTTTGRVHKGRVLTGDRFLVQSMMEGHRYLRDSLLGDVVEMEGASVGLVATVNRLPFVIIRTVSDKADANAHIDFAKFLPRAGRNSLNFVSHILSALPPEEGDSNG